MRRGKKILALALIGLLIAGVFAGCRNNGKEAEPSTAPTTIPTTEPTTVPSEPTTVPTTAPTEPATEPTDAIVSLYLQEPDGFLQDPSGMYLWSPNYPTDPSFISITASPANEAILQNTAEDYEAILKTMYAALLGEGATATVESLEQTEVDGFPALQLTYTMENGETKYQIVEYDIVADQNYAIGFADATGGDWSEAFTATAASIDFLKAGEIATPNYSGLTQYDLDCGLSIKMNEGFQVSDMENASGFLESERAAFMVILDDYASLSSLGYGKSLTLEQYAALVQEAYETGAFGLDPLGNLFTTFVEDSGDTEIYYYVTVKQTESGFWTCIFYCYSDDQSAYQNRFPLWASSIAAE